MDKKIKWVIGIGLFIAFLALAVWGYQTLIKDYRENRVEENVIGNTVTNTAKIKAPDFTVYNKDKNIVKLSDFANKPVVINFWATWCGFCVEEMPTFQEMYQKYPDVVFLMVNATDGIQETFSKAQKFIADNKYSFPVYYDLDSNAMEQYGIYSFPTTLFIDREGNIAKKQLGLITKDKLEYTINIIK